MEKAIWISRNVEKRNKMDIKYAREKKTKKKKAEDQHNAL